METIVNKVAESGIITLDLSPFIPTDEIAAFDLKPFLFREMILKEKDYRAALQTHDWQQFVGKHVALHCSTDAIIPVWAYMLAASYLQPVVCSVYYGTPDELSKVVINNTINAIDLSEYAGKRVVLKGCGDTPVPEAAYVAATNLLRPVVKSLMYGEPCSTVPIYKAK
ncbi:MAG: hypothetical protein K0Q79_3430 [Flavipsychrobacter sp.]|jgi:hypothetical protein|nr:hypothetical protein [Flavipsychrobacter sp.]